MSYAQYPVGETITANGDEVRHLFNTDTHWVIALADGVAVADVGSNVEACSMSNADVESAAAERFDADELAAALSPHGVFALPAGDEPVAGEGL